jgi:ubiquinone/menaquinone biosynthesis C-methylase UbiE
MKPEDVLETYDRDYAERYDRTFLVQDPHSQEKLRCELEILERLLAERGDATRWADVACGTGHVLSRFPNVQRTGLDLSPAMLEVARRKLSDVPLVRGDFRDPTHLPVGGFDVISSMWWAYSLVDSISDIHTLVGNLARWLSDDGVCFMPIGEPSRNLYGGEIPIPYVATEDAPIYGGRIRVTAVLWSWTESDGKRHDNMIIPQVEYMQELFAEHFASVEIIPYFHAYRAIVARKR